MPELFNTTRLQGKTAIVTGASSGIGASTAILFARAGANVVLLARRKEALDSVAEQCAAAAKEMGQSPQIIVRTLDVNDRAAVDALVPALKEAGVKTFDVLVNNAGGAIGTERAGDIKMDDVDFMVNTNLVSLVQVTQVFLPEMKKQDSGHVINIGSLAGREAYVGGAIYCAVKHAVKAFTQSLLKELVATGIRVSEVAPGFAETNFAVTRFRGDEEAAKAVYKGFTPLVAEDIAEEIVWCAMRPPHVQIAELYVLPSAQGAATIIHRKE
jgi:3-hydroxy acid dehydrogenase/malonic semialdehyde reductase